MTQTERNVLLSQTSVAETYAALAPELIRFASALVGPEDAQDVLSSAVVKSLSSPGWLRVSNRRAYLYRAVLNEALTHRRRVAQRWRREGRISAGPHWDAPNLHPEVRAAVQRLSVRQRAVIALTYWQDLTPAATAERLGISEGAVRRHLARARSRLREVLNA
jgi:RNA polymerase sigma factor (sigma-70 family)